MVVTDRLRIDVSPDGHRARVTIDNPPHNYFDRTLLAGLAERCELLAAQPGCRVVVIASTGPDFCAGADLRRPAPANDPRGLYREALRLFALEIPVVAAVQGRAIGGGVGLACAADFRVCGPSSRFDLNFARIGLHHGFGLSITLPELVGPQRAAELCLTARRIDGPEAVQLGLCDRLAPTDHELLAVADELAVAIAGSAPLAVRAMRASLRGDRLERIRAALDREQDRQLELAGTADLREGIAAARDRRPPRFVGA
jgi:enoyl-CoA hydratase/carnithine racemase